ncbi:Hypothetical_protein [Hexamita inflata]|uniref:Hypothetical_protein n=1 Tax=Hexamita inflata TaxID=28002 RepID=A0AA86PBM3_9EUKA|nr:Hypothetical protein HINF_LOCUS23188 [Hexamita inflata]
MKINIYNQFIINTRNLALPLSKLCNITRILFKFPLIRAHGILQSVFFFPANSFRFSSGTIFAAPDSTTSPPCWARVGGGLRRSAGSGSGSSASQDFHWRKEWDAKMRVELYSITNPTVFQLPV